MSKIEKCQSQSNRKKSKPHTESHTTLIFLLFTPADSLKGKIKKEEREWKEGRGKRRKQVENKREEDKYLSRSQLDQLSQMFSLWCRQVALLLESTFQFVHLKENERK